MAKSSNLVKNNKLAKTKRQSKLEKKENKSKWKDNKLKLNKLENDF